MNYILRPKNYEEWMGAAVEKILKTIDSCKTNTHLEAAKTMVDNFVIVTALEDIKENDLEEIINLFWIRIKLQQKTINNASN